MLLLDRDDVARLLDLDALIDALAPAMVDLSAGRASVPDRTGAEVPEVGGRLFAMPGSVPSQGALVTKLVSLFPRNAGTRLPTHQAVIVVFDPETGEPAALLDGTVITAARTAACSARTAPRPAAAAPRARPPPPPQGRPQPPPRGGGGGCGPGRTPSRCAGCAPL